MLLPQVAFAIYGTLGGKLFTITLIALPLLAYWYVRRKLPITAMVIVVLIAVFVIFPLYNTYRVQNRHLQMGERVGSLERGKDADLVLTSGDPLDPRSHIELVLIDGRVQYSRSADGPTL